VVTRAQQPERVRRIGILLPAAADDPVYQTWVGAFLQGLAVLGWTIGRNVRIDIRWSGPNIADINRHAAELVALSPDVILAHGAGGGSLAIRSTSVITRASMRSGNSAASSASGSQVC